MSETDRPAHRLSDRRRRPNVIWIFGDQHRAQAMTHRGDPNLSTPNLDRLADDGVQFRAAVAGAPWCTPFRASLLTSMYPHQHGADRTPSKLDPAIPTVAQPFRQAGYHTAWFGKWHVGGSNAPMFIPPPERGGFDHWLGYENNNAQYRVYVHGSGAEEPVRLRGYETDALTDHLIAHLTAHVGAGSGKGQGAAGGGRDYQPFFAVLSVQPPHDPYVAPPEFAGRRRPGDVRLRPNVPHAEWVRQRARLGLAGYYAMIENLDWNLGRLREALARLDVDEETYLVFFSDHGDMLGCHGQFGKSCPWEEAVRIPCIIGGLHNAGLSRARHVTDAVINHVDLAPTTLGLCGIEPPASMVGHDYSRHVLPQDHPLFRDWPNADEEPDSAYLQQIPAKRHAHTVNKPWRAVVTRDGWKYAVQEGHDWLMHHVHDDPYEQANLAHDTAFAEPRRRLHRRLSQWIEQTGDRFAMPPLE
jgi:arylsulfatase A-like enzyme